MYNVIYIFYTAPLIFVVVLNTVHFSHVKDTICSLVCTIVYNLGNYKEKTYKNNRHS